MDEYAKEIRDVQREIERLVEADGDAEAIRELESFPLRQDEIVGLPGCGRRFAPCSERRECEQRERCADENTEYSDQSRAAARIDAGACGRISGLSHVRPWRV